MRNSEKKEREREMRKHKREYKFRNLRIERRIKLNLGVDMEKNQVIKENFRETKS